LKKLLEECRESRVAAYQFCAVSEEKLKVRG
jgi:hypothetical protein